MLAEIKIYHDCSTGKAWNKAFDGALGLLMEDRGATTITADLLNKNEKVIGTLVVIKSASIWDKYWDKQTSTRELVRAKFVDANRLGRNWFSMVASESGKLVRPLFDSVPRRGPFPSEDDVTRRNVR